MTSNVIPPELLMIKLHHPMRLITSRFNLPPDPLSMLGATAIKKPSAERGKRL